MLVVKLGELRMLVLKNTGGNRVRDFKRKAGRLSAGRYRHVAIGLVCRMKGLSHLERITLGYIVLRLHVSRENAHGRSARHEIQLLLLTVWIPTRYDRPMRRCLFRQDRRFPSSKRIWHDMGVAFNSTHPSGAVWPHDGSLQFGSDECF